MTVGRTARAASAGVSPASGARGIVLAAPGFLALFALFALFGAAPAAALETTTLAERSYLSRFLTPTLPSNLILSLAVDTLDTRSVFVGTADGLCRTNGRYFRRYGAGGQEGPEGRDINAVLLHRHFLVVGTDDGLSVYNHFTERWSHYGAAQGLAAPVQALAEYGVEVLVGTWGEGVRFFDPVKGAFRECPVRGAEKAHVTSLHGDPAAKRVAVGTLRAGLFLATPQGTRHLARDGGGLPSDRVNGIAPGDGGTLYLATGAGVVELSGAEGRVHTTDDGLPSDIVLCVAADPLGAWAGTDRGIARLRGGKWTAHPIRNALSGGDPVRALCLLRVGGRLWIGTSHQGLVAVDER